MTQLTNEIYAVEVPEGAENIRLGKPLRINNRLYFDVPLAAIEHPIVDLPPGNWEIICTTKEVTELKAACIVDSDGSGWEDYIKTGYPFTSALDSLRSLLAVKGLDLEKNYVVIKKAA